MSFSLSELKIGSPVGEKMILIEKWVHAEMTQFSNQHGLPGWIEVSYNQIIKNFKELEDNVETF